MSVFQIDFHASRIVLQLQSTRVILRFETDAEKDSNSKHLRRTSASPLSALKPLLLVAMPFAPSSVLAPSSKARSP